LADRRQARHHRLADLLATLPREDEAALALAMHVALPIVERLIHNAAESGTPTGLPPTRDELRHQRGR
jgi:hypothetical protein